MPHSLPHPVNLLVTGGAGFIGSHFIEGILDDPQVHKLVNLDALTYAGNLANLHAAANHPRYHFEQADLREKDAVLRIVRDHGITHVVHLAAETHVDNSIADPNAFIHTNVTGTFHLLEACRETWNPEPTTKNLFLHISTDEVYGTLGPNDPPFTEDSPFRPNSPYAASKAAADHLVRSYVQTYAFPAVITRCSNNFGPRQHGEKLIPTVLRCLHERKPIPLFGDGLQIRDWIHVTDHCAALRQILTSAKPGDVFNIGARDERTNLALAQTLCDLFDQAHPEFSGPSRALITHVPDRPGHDRRYANDATRLQSRFGAIGGSNMAAARWESLLNALVQSDTLSSRATNA